MSFRERRRRRREAGVTLIPATAIVTRVEEPDLPGVSVTDVVYRDQVVELGLEVRVGRGAPFDLVVTQVVPISTLARLQPGASLDLTVDPRDHRAVAIDWQALT